MDRPAPELEALQPYPSGAYVDIDLNRLLVYVLGWLRDTGLPPTFENIVVSAFRLFPDKFSLRGFEYPDANRVNRGLLQLKPKYRNWARGSTARGFALTPGGEVALSQVRDLLSRDSRGKQRAQEPPELTSTKGYTWDPREELSELRLTEAYRRFAGEGASAVSADDVWNVLNAFSHTPPDAIRGRLRTLARIASDLQDSVLEQFIKVLGERFGGWSQGQSRGRRRARVRD